MVSLLSIPFWVIALLISFVTSPFSGLLNIGVTILIAIALVFLFQRESSEWFREMKVKY